MSKESGASVGFGCIAIIAMIPLSLLMRAFVLTKLWGWFVIQFGLPQISLAHAYGLSIAVHMLVGMDNVAVIANVKTESESAKSIWQAIGKMFAQSFITPLLVLFIAWLCHLCM